MKPYCKGVARIRHKKTGKIYVIKADELDWQDVGVDERKMGAEYHYEAEVEHPDLGTLVWDLYEYPVNVQNHMNTNVNNHIIIEDFDFGLEHENEHE